MTFDPASRLAQMFGNTTNVPAPRSEAQREASRRNGAKSSGPVTSQGKFKSRSNAVKHGLGSNVTSLPGDTGEHRRHIQEIHEQLVAEFDPQTFTECTTIESLAFEIYQLSRGRRMVELFHRPTTGGNAGDLAKFRKLQRHRRDGELMDEAMVVCRLGADFTFSDSDAEQLADVIVEFVEQTLFEAEQVDPDEGCSADEFERQEDRRFRKLLKIVKPASKKAGDHREMVKLFSGLRPLGKLELKRLIRLLDHLSIETRNWVRQHSGIEEQIAAIDDARLMELAGSADRLVLLNRYVAEIERGVERKLNRLERR